MANLNNNKNNSNKSNNKTNKVKVHKVPIISSEALALAGKVHSKFPASEYEEVYELLNDFVDSLNVDEDGIITLETFWECGDCIEGIDCDECPDDYDIDCETCTCRKCEEVYESDDGYEDVEDDTEPFDVMLFDIDFNEEALIEEINIAIEHNGKNYKPYLIMSKSTLLEFENFNDEQVYIEHRSEEDLWAADYILNDTNYRIVIDNDLDFGVVKVR